MKLTLAVLFLLLSRASAVTAQQAILRGTVRDSSGTPVSGAEVTVTAGNVRATADRDGAFHLFLPSGAHALVVRHVGYVSLTDTVRVDAGAELVRDYVLARVPVVLDSMSVTARGGRAVPQLSVFERRRVAGFGHFITAAELRTQDGRQLDDILRSIPGTRLFYYQGASYLATGRAAGSLGAMQAAVPTDEKSPHACWVQIVVDGARIFAPVAGAAVDSRFGTVGGMPVPDLAQWRGRDLEAIEYYAGPAATPAELKMTGSACGTLVLWTRRR